MSSPETSSILTASPKPIRGNSAEHSPLRRRASAASDYADPLPRLSPTLGRSYNPNDPEVRERQRAMDADMAMQLSRARSNSVAISVASSPVHGLSFEDTYPGYTLQEEQDLASARGAGNDHPPEHFHPGPSPDAHLNHLSAGHDPSLVVSVDNAVEMTHDHAMGGLPMYQASADRSTFDFAALEAYAREEKSRLGISSPTSPTAMGSSKPPFELPGDGQSTASSFTIPPPIPRVRHRLLSQSDHRPRRGKMALFEQPGVPPPTLASRAPHLASDAHGATLSAVPSYDNISGSAEDLGVGGATQLPGLGGTGHDRPYRFSFYSNALSATIHARSLSELPAEGQTFDSLFSGDQPVRPGMGMGKKMGPTGNAPSGIANLATRMGSGGGTGGSGDGIEGNTWWLDVQSPTDDEMKLLSKVFAIHPLTTEDIQMEETREKIELFRNYYLVCFRGFDQDPYSPTHLEPLNMYIIVFREGILSFHFRPTPHPQNVRRRIKQLKDYISVTSDWISYALIDDITDAFGPLIQSIEYEVDSIDELVLILKEAEQSDMLRRIGTCRKKVMGLLRLMGNKADVVKGLAKRCNENWRVAPTSDIGLYLSDIQDHLITMTQNLNHYEKILSRSHSNYLAQISIEMTDANNQINDVLSKLTALGTVLIPMNLVTGLWGMNVHVPGQDVPGFAWFGSIIGVLAAFAVVAGWSTYKLMVGR